MKNILKILINVVGVVLIAALGAVIWMATILLDYECRAILKWIGLL